jgi:phage recombination protein Bet
MCEENKQIEEIKKDPWSVQYEFKAGTNDVSISLTDVYNMIASGYEKPTIGECTVFLEMCKDLGLNPFLKDAYLMKYSQKEPATIVVGKNAFMKRAESHPMYKGFQAGLIVENKEGMVDYKEGSFISKDLTVLGAWCKVYRDDRTHPFLIEVDVNEYVGKKKNGEKNQQWATKEKTMIRKVAIVQCLREAFPQELNAMYVEEEFQKKTVEAHATIEGEKEELTPDHFW